MKIGFIPPELLNICEQAVNKFHHENGFGKLAARIETAQNLDALGQIPEARAVLDRTNQYFKIRKWSFLGSILVVCFTVLIPWWSLSALVAIFIADMFLGHREKDGWKLLAAVLLSLEMLTNDFSDWGKRYSQERAEALRILKCNPQCPDAAWLDYYLPGWSNLDPATLKTFEPVRPGDVS